ncbi:MAG TPA: tyrosine-type recombinase/integrase [Waddliaceae bacterium]
MKNMLIPITPSEIYNPSQVEYVRYANSFTEQDMSKNSICAYLSDWEDFCRWCNHNHRQFMPANPHDVADYLEDRAKNSWVGISGKNRDLKEKTPLKWNSLERRLTAITKIHQYNGYNFSRKDSAIRRTLNGIKRVLSKEQTHQILEDRKSPVLMEDIRKMIGSLPDTLTGKRDRCLLLIGFSGALRRSELASIQKENLKFLKEGIVVLLPWSKTGMREVNIPYGSNPDTCPVRALQEWIHAANIENGAVFRAINRHNQIQLGALSDKSIVLIINRNRYIRDTVKEAEEKQIHDSTVTIPNFGGHSLRAGFVTQAILNDVPEHSIMEHTGHKKSDTLKKYIREVNKWKNNAATKLGL